MHFKIFFQCTSQLTNWNVSRNKSFLTRKDFLSCSHEKTLSFLHRIIFFLQGERKTLLNSILVKIPELLLCWLPVKNFIIIINVVDVRNSYLHFIESYGNEARKFLSRGDRVERWKKSHSNMLRCITKIQFLTLTSNLTMGKNWNFFLMIVCGHSKESFLRFVWKVLESILKNFNDLTSLGKNKKFFFQNHTLCNMCDDVHMWKRMHNIKLWSVVFCLLNRIKENIFKELLNLKCTTKKICEKWTTFGDAHDTFHAS